jgi:hypothetical protein
MNLTYNCFLKLFPDDRAGVVVLTNQCDEEVLWEMVTSLYDHVLEMPRPDSFAFATPTPLSRPPDENQLHHYAGAYMNGETADIATFVVAEDRLVMERHGKSLPLVSVGEDQFYTEISEKYRLPVTFIRGRDGEITHVMIGGEPYHPHALSTTFEPDLHLWQSFEGLYKDPSNSYLDEIFTVRLRDGALSIAEGNTDVGCKAIGPRAFAANVGLFEFEDTQSDGVKILKWGKATRYYPLDQHEYRANKVIRYLVDVPVVPLRVS